jgi:hypothetical protein
MTALVWLCALAVAFLIVCGFGAILELLWTEIAVAAFGAPLLTYWQCVGLWVALLLVAMLFRGTRSGSK